MIHMPVSLPKIAVTFALVSGLFGLPAVAGCESAEPVGTTVTVSTSTTAETALAPATTSTAQAPTTTTTESIDEAAGEGLYPAPIPGKYGFIDKTGAWVIEPRFPYVWGFSEGLCPVQPEVEGPWGYIDIRGSLVIEPRFEYPGGFSEGLAAVREQVDGLWGYIDKTGSWAIEPQFTSAGEFSEGLAVTSLTEGEDGEYGYIDKTGAWVIEPRFMYARAFSEGLAAVAERGGPWGLIDKTGAMVVVSQSPYPHGSFSEGLAVVRDENDKYGYIDATGATVIQPRFDMAWPFSDGLALVGMGLKDPSYGGDVLAAEALSTVFPPPGGFEHYAYIDKTGEVVIEGEFDDANSFSDGLAAVYVDGKLGFIDTSGAWAIRPQFRCRHGRFDRGLALLQLEFEDGQGYTWFYRVYIDKTGEVVWRAPW